MGTSANLGFHRCHLPQSHLPHFFSNWGLCLLLLFGLFLLLKLLHVGIIDLPLGKSKMRRIIKGKIFTQPAPLQVLWLEESIISTPVTQFHDIA